MKIIYNALLLTKESRSLLLKTFPPAHQNVFGEHITLEFNPKELPNNIGEIVEVEVIGHKKDKKGQAVVVNIGNERTKNKVPHITISVDKNEKPFYSNQLLSDMDWTKTKPLLLKTTVASFVNGKFITKLDH